MPQTRPLDPADPSAAEGSPRRSVAAKARRPKGAIRGIVPAGVVALAAVAGYLLLWPVPIDPAPWTPPPAPGLIRPYAPNQELAGARWIEVGGRGPETAAVDARGRLYTGLEDGRIVRVTPAGALEDFVTTGGRPLGLVWDGNGNLLVADAHRGLLSVSLEGKVTVLATEHRGLPFRFTDDLDIAPDGVVYFSDASHRFGVEQYVLDLLEHRPNGRLLAYYPETGQTRLLLDELYFANGVAVDPAGAFVLVVETGRYRVTRYWLRGERAGTRDTLIDNLPGFPDGISAGSDGTFWLAIASPRDPQVDERLLPRPWLRKVVARLPAALRPQAQRHAFVLGLDAEGRVVANLQDPAPTSFAPVTSVVEHRGTLYLGTIELDAVAAVPVP
jgi:sugar lactone lactonase YvrE